MNNSIKIFFPFVFSGLSCVISLRSAWVFPTPGENWTFIFEIGPSRGETFPMFALFWLEHLSYAICCPAKAGRTFFSSFISTKALNALYQNDKFVLVKILKWLINCRGNTGRKFSFRSPIFQNEWVSMFVIDFVFTKTNNENR